MLLNPYSKKIYGTAPWNLFLSHSEKPGFTVAWPLPWRLANSNICTQLMAPSSEYE